MSRPRSQITATLPIVFGLSEEEAAGAIGISPSKFRQLVQQKRMPAPRRLDGRKLYDVDELRGAFKSLPHDGEETDGTGWEDVV